MTEQKLKEALKDSPFRTVFKATLAFYLAQTLMTFLGLGLLTSVFIAIYEVFR